MINSSKSIWDSFVHKYSLSKTLRFELQPISKTLDFIKEKGLIEEDKQREKEFNLVKKIIDSYYIDFIDDSLVKINIDYDLLKKYNDIYQNLKKDKYNLDLKKELKLIQDKVRLNIYDQISCVHEFKLIFGKELIKDILPKWLESKNRLEDKELILKFDKWNTYFTGFFENRKNVFSKDPIPTSIIYRIVHDNLLKYFDNLDKFNKIKLLPDFNSTSIEKELNVELNNKNLDYYFNLSNFNLFLSQRGIELFNVIIGGKSIDNIKIKGLNELINLYSQNEKDIIKSKNIRKLKMTPLFKQILSERQSFSDKFDIINDNSCLIKQINIYYDDEFNKNILKLVDLISKLDQYDLDQIYINKNSITGISNKIFKDWSIISSGLKEYFIKNYNLNSKKAESRLNQKYFSIFEIQEGVKLLNLDRGNYNNFTDNFIFDYFKNLINDEIIKSISSSKLDFDKIIYNNLNSFNNNDKQLIKGLLDLVIEFYNSIKPLYVNIKLSSDEKVQEAYELDSEFYNDFEIIMSSFKKIIPLYNKTRNYLTKKPYATKKFKLNFENSTLLNGWDLNKEKDNYSLLFKKDGQYYLGICSKGHSNEITKYIRNYNLKSNDYFEKIDYKLLPGPYKMLPKTFFSKTHISYYSPSEEIISIRNHASYSKNGTPQDGFNKKEFNLSDCHKLINFYKFSLNKHPEWKLYNFNFKPTNQYKDINEFYQDVEDQGYNLSYKEVDSKYIFDLVDSGQLFLFKIYNKDFSNNKKNSNSKDNLHTIYWKELFSAENLSNLVYKLNGEAEIFFREKSNIKDNTIHVKNKLIKNKDPINNKSESIFEYDIIKDKRYTQDKFLFHCPITINFKAKGNGKDINKQIKNYIKDFEGNINILSIDRGERHLLYYTLIDSNGKIITQDSFNNLSDGLDRSFDYHDKLDQREKERDQSRKSWSTIENIKDLKEGYLSRVIHEISKIAIENNAIIVLEDLNFGFKKGRFKIEKQIYQKFEKMLIDKLNFLIFKKTPKESIGGPLNGYQLTNKFDSFSKLGKQSGILFYVPASYTSKIDPTTGFFDLIKPKYESIDKSIQLISKFEFITYCSDMDMFEFNFDYSNFNNELKLTKKNWSIYSNGLRLYSFRNKDKNNEWDIKEINLTSELKSLFESYSVDYKSNKNLIDRILLIDSKEFFEKLIFILKLTLQLRNSIPNTKDDYIISCVKNNDGHFYDTRENVSSKVLPINADSNGAYNIGIKGIMILNKIKQELDLKITKEEYVNFIINKNSYGK
jgi:CRISPR-associated protein Cpf1